MEQIKRNDVYSVRHRHIDSKKWFVINDVVDDECFVELMETPQGIRPIANYPIRSILLKTGERVEIPMLTHVFEFSAEREEIQRNKTKMRMAQMEALKTKQQAKPPAPPPISPGKPDSN